MKKLGLGLLVIAAIFMGCKKEEKFCWDCVTTVKQFVTGQTPSTATSNSAICDKTEEEIRALELGAQNTTTASVSGITVTQTIMMKCTKK